MNLSAEQFERFVTKHKGAVQLAKMTPKMLVYVPQGRIIFEQAVGARPCFGFRAAVITTAPGAKARVEESLRLYGNMATFKQDSPEFLCLHLAMQHAHEGARQGAGGAAAATAAEGVPDAHEGAAVAAEPEKEKKPVDPVESGAKSPEASKHQDDH